MNRQASPRQPIHPSYGRAMLESLLPQALVALLCGLTLDSGQMAQFFGMALLAFWGGVAVLIWRRPTRPTGLDLSLIRIGYLPVFFLTLFIAPTIWHWRGVLR